MRVHTVAKARKEQGVCGSCHEPIKVGDGYRYIAPRYGPKKKRHLGCPSFRPSEMTSSKIATAYAAQEGGEDDLDLIAKNADVKDTASAEAFVDEVKAVMSAVADGVNECISDYQDGYDNMPENFQSGPTGEDIQEKIDTLESFVSDLEGFEPDTSPESIEEAADDDEADPFGDYVSDVIEQARELIGSLEL